MSGYHRQYEYGCCIRDIAYRFLKSRMSSERGASGHLGNSTFVWIVGGPERG